MSQWTDAKDEILDVDTGLTQRMSRGYGVLQNPQLWRVICQRFRLSPREVEVAIYMILGYRNSEMARKMGIARRTANRHVSLVYTKLRVKTARRAIIKLILASGVLIQDL